MAKLTWYQKPLTIGVIYIVLILLFCFCLASSIFMLTETIEHGGSAPSTQRFANANKTTTIGSALRANSLTTASVGNSNGGQVVVQADLLPVVSGTVSAGNGPGHTRPWVTIAVGEPVAAGDMLKLQSNGYAYRANSPFVYQVDTFQAVSRVNYDNGSYPTTSFQNTVFDSTTGIMFQISTTRRDGKNQGYDIIRSRANSLFPKAIYVDDSKPAVETLDSSSHSWDILAIQKASIASEDGMNLVALAVPSPWGQRAGEVSIIGGRYFFRTQTETTLPDGSIQVTIGVNPFATNNLFDGYDSYRINYSNTYPITAAYIIATSNPNRFVLVTVEDQIYLDWIEFDSDVYQLVTKSGRTKQPRMSLGPGATGIITARTMTVLPFSVDKAEVIFTRDRNVFSITLDINPNNETITLLRPQLLNSSLPSSTGTEIAATMFTNDQWVIGLTHVDTQSLFLISLQFNPSSGRKTNISPLQLASTGIRSGVLSFSRTINSEYQWILYGSSSSDNQLYLRKIQFGRSFLGIGNEYSLNAGTPVNNVVLADLIVDKASVDTRQYMFVTSNRLITIHDELENGITDCLGIAQQGTDVFTDNVYVATVGQISTIHNKLSTGSAIYWDDINMKVTSTLNQRGRIGVALSSNELLITRLF